MDIVVHSMTDERVLKVLKYTIYNTLNGNIKWKILSSSYNTEKEVEIKQYFASIPYTLFSIKITVEKSVTPIDTMKYIRVRSIISYTNVEQNKCINLIYNPLFFNTFKLQYKPGVYTIDSLLVKLVELFDFIKFNSVKEKLLEFILMKILYNRRKYI